VGWSARGISKKSLGKPGGESPSIALGVGVAKTVHHFHASKERVELGVINALGGEK